MSAMCVHVQNIRDYPQTKIDSEIISPFLFDEHGDSRFFYQEFAKNSLLKNKFEEEKKSLVAEHDLVLENSSQLGEFWPRRGL